MKSISPVLQESSSNSKVRVALTSRNPSDEYDGNEVPTKNVSRLNNPYNRIATPSSDEDDYMVERFKQNENTRVGAKSVTNLRRSCPDKTVTLVHKLDNKKGLMVNGN